jgi:hypothetical protein
MTDLTMCNGYILIDPIYTVPNTESDLVNPFNGLPLTSKENYEDHPFRALVIFAPEYYRDGGIKYPSDIKKGDIVILPGEISSMGTQFIVNQKKMYPAIRYSSVLAHYTPSEEEAKSLKFKRDFKPKPKSKLIVN